VVGDGGGDVVEHVAAGLVGGVARAGGDGHADLAAFGGDDAELADEVAALAVGAPAALEPGAGDFTEPVVLVVDDVAHRLEHGFRSVEAGQVRAEGGLVGELPFGFARCDPCLEFGGGVAAGAEHLVDGFGGGGFAAHGHPHGFGGAVVGFGDHRRQQVLDPFALAQGGDGDGHLGGGP